MSESGAGVSRSPMLSPRVGRSSTGGQDDGFERDPIMTRSRSRSQSPAPVVPQSPRSPRARIPRDIDQAQHPPSSPLAGRRRMRNAADDDDGHDDRDPLLGASGSKSPRSSTTPRSRSPARAAAKSPSTGRRRGRGEEGETESGGMGLMALVVPVLLAVVCLDWRGCCVV